MNKLIVVLLGLLAGLISIFFFNELIEFLASALLLKGQTQIAFNGFKICLTLPAAATNVLFAYAAVLITPLAGSVFFIEITLFWLNKTVSDVSRTFIIIFQLINIGYLIITIFTAIISVLLRLSFSTDWLQLLNCGKISYNQGLVFLLLVTIILLSYINVLAKRIKKSIPVISRK
ncbi:MAG: hypothetical protein P4L45_08880 [Ignavibacteriaceae bacterium]|nr:hypothetical protein [Ignavibacteriaceae bacterium]